jgi:hypothetical protein
MKVYRQGDVSIIQLTTRPMDAWQEKPDLILAEGEETGHRHRIINGEVQLYMRRTGSLYLCVLSETACVYHEEHEDVILPKGDYEVRHQEEFDWLREETRYVRD